MLLPSSRLPVLDVLRGIAILGTLATNVWVFTNPAGSIGDFNGPPPTDTLEIVLRQLSTGKFLALLSIMFGVGLAIQHRAASTAGRQWPGNYPWRALLLFLDGVLNYFLVIEFDVLMGYAVSGLVVAWLLCTSERAQWRWLLGLVAVHLTILTAASVALSPFPPPEFADPFAFAASLEWNPFRDGNWWELVKFRAENLLMYRMVEPTLIMPMTIALFLLGAQLFRAGVFEERGTRLRRKLMLVGAVALPVDIAIALYAGMPWWFFTRWGTAALVALGLLGAVAEFHIRRPAPGWMGRRLGEVGRTALSCYVFQNILATAICYGWGLDLAGRIDESQRLTVTVLLYLALCPVIMLAAHLWLRRFERGPLEMAWNASYRGLSGRNGRAGGTTGAA